MNRTMQVAPLVLAVALAGCDDMLTETPKSFLTTESYYSSPADIEAATFAAYEPLRQADVWRRWLLWDAELASDQVRVHPDEPNFGTYAPGLLMWGPEMSNAVNPWNGLYATIYRANLVLERATEVQFTDAAYQKRLIAEAKFLRAYAYLLLTKMYDEVPLLVSLQDHAEAASRPRTPVEQIHAQIAKDLVEAEADLPNRTDLAKEHGRAPRAAAQMVLADLYQWRSSFLKKNEWKQVADWSRKVVENPSWGLMNDYIAGFLPSNKGNKEVIWMVPSTGLENRSSFDINCNWLPRELGFGTAGGCEVVGQPTEWFYNSFPRGDYRHQVIYRTEGCSTSAAIGCKKFKWPNINKYRATNNGVGGPVDVDFPLYRYAEALLMYAEAQFEMGNVAEATRYVNMVRARARQGAGSERRAEPADLATVTRDDIYMERNWELAHEAKRWFDQVRRDSLDPGYWKTTLMLHDPETAARGDMSEFRKRLPIPGPELRLNSAMKQNPGY